jgi:hypothetical protein
VFSCKANHRWFDPRAEVYITVRTFETMFDARFDDNIRSTGIEFTGYNAGLGIAFTHAADTVPARCLVQAEVWCKAQDVILVVIKTTRASSIAQFIAEAMFAAGKLPKDVRAQTMTNRTRTRMHQMDSVHKLLADRCEFSLF